MDLKQITITLVPFVTTTTDGGAIEEGQKKRFCLQDLSLLWWFHRKFLRFDIVGFLGFSLLTCAGTKKLICNFFQQSIVFVRMDVFIQDDVLFSRQPSFKKTMRIDAVAGFRLLLKLIVCHKMGAGPCLP